MHEFFKYHWELITHEIKSGYKIGDHTPIALWGVVLSAWSAITVFLLFIVYNISIFLFEFISDL
jgi:hypothetical protein